MCRDGNDCEDTIRDSDEPGRSKMVLSWKSKAALALGVGLPIAAVAMPAVAVAEPDDAIDAGYVSIGGNNAANRSSEVTDNSYGHSDNVDSDNDNSGNDNSNERVARLASVDITDPEVDILASPAPRSNYVELAPDNPPTPANSNDFDNRPLDNVFAGSEPVIGVAANTLSPINFTMQNIAVENIAVENIAVENIAVENIADSLGQFSDWGPGSSETEPLGETFEPMDFPPFGSVDGAPLVSSEVIEAPVQPVDIEVTTPGTVEEVASTVFYDRNDAGEIVREHQLTPDGVTITDLETGETEFKPTKVGVLSFPGAKAAGNAVKAVREFYRRYPIPIIASSTVIISSSVGVDADKKDDVDRPPHVVNEAGVNLLPSFEDSIYEQASLENPQPAAPVITNYPVAGVYKTAAGGWVVVGTLGDDTIIVDKTKDEARDAYKVTINEVPHYIDNAERLVIAGIEGNDSIAGGPEDDLIVTGPGFNLITDEWGDNQHFGANPHNPHNRANNEPFDVVLAPFTRTHARDLAERGAIGAVVATPNTAAYQDALDGIMNLQRYGQTDSAAAGRHALQTQNSVTFEVSEDGSGGFSSPGTVYVQTGSNRSLEWYTHEMHHAAGAKHSPQFFGEHGEINAYAIGRLIASAAGENNRSLDEMKSATFRSLRGSLYESKIGEITDEELKEKIDTAFEKALAKMPEEASNQILNGS